MPICLVKTGYEAPKPMDISETPKFKEGDFVKVIFLWNRNNDEYEPRVFGKINMVVYDTHKASSFFIYRIKTISDGKWFAETWELEDDLILMRAGEAMCEFV